VFNLVQFKYMVWFYFNSSLLMFSGTAGMAAISMSSFSNKSFFKFPGLMPGFFIIFPPE